MNVNQSRLDTLLTDLTDTLAAIAALSAAPGHERVEVHVSSGGAHMSADLINNDGEVIRPVIEVTLRERLAPLTADDLWVEEDGGSGWFPDAAAIARILASPDTRHELEVVYAEAAASDWEVHTRVDRGFETREIDIAQPLDPSLADWTAMVWLGDGERERFEVDGRYTATATEVIASLAARGITDGALVVRRDL